MENTAAVSNLVEDAQRERTRKSWLLSTPALMVLAFAASGPLLIVLVYSFLSSGEYGGVIWKFSTDAWFNVVFHRDIFDGTMALADAHLIILWRSVKLSFFTTVTTLMIGFPTAYFIATRPQKTRNIWLFLITVPFWTNLLIRTFAILEATLPRARPDTSTAGVGPEIQPVNCNADCLAITSSSPCRSGDNLPNHRQRASPSSYRFIYQSLTGSISRDIAVSPVARASSSASRDFCISCSSVASRAGRPPTVPTDSVT